MNRMLWLRRAAVGFGTLCLMLASWWYLAAPKTLRVAVGPQGSLQHRYFQALSRALADQQKPFRFELVIADTTVAAGKLMEARKVDLAVLRSDETATLEARSIAILGRRSIVLLAPKSSGIESLKTLEGRRIAIISPGGEYSDLIGRIAGHYGASIHGASITEFTIRQFVQNPQPFDAFVIVADPAFEGSKPLFDAIEGLAGGPLGIIGMPGAAGLSLRLRELQKATVPEGAFGGAPPKPEAEVETVAVTYELTASSMLTESDGLALLKALIDVRTRMRRLLPRSTFNIEPPPVDDQRQLLPHVGAIAYVNDDETKSFLETWSEQIWLALFALSIAGSSVTGFLAWSGFFNEPVSSGELHARVSGLAQRLTVAEEGLDLDAAQDEIDNIVLTYLCYYGRTSHDGEAELALALWTASLNQIIERRRTLVREASDPAAGNGHQRPGMQVTGAL